MVRDGSARQGLTISRIRDVRHGHTRGGHKRPHGLVEESRPQISMVGY